MYLSVLMLQAFIEFFQFNFDQTWQGIMLYRLIMQAAVNPVQKLRIEFTLHDFFNNALGGYTFQAQRLHLLWQVAEFLQILLCGLCADITRSEEHTSELQS